MTKRIVLLFWMTCFTLLATQAQVRVYKTFKDTRIINAHSVEITEHHKLDVRIAHRFGDIGGDRGGWKNFYGLENATDILIGVDYGLAKNVSVGLFRTKGASQLRQLLHGQLKYRIFHQTEGDEVPLTLTATLLSSMSTMEESTDPESLASFDNFSHRMSYHAQFLLARKFSNHFSLQASAGYVHRNQVPFNDDNGLIHIGVASRIQITKLLGFIFDLNYPISSLRSTENGFYMPLGLGLEVETGGHVFQINLTNTTGIMETDYLPYTFTNWGDGEFRLGFTISRLFNL